MAFKPEKFNTSCKACGFSGQFLKLWINGVKEDSAYFSYQAKTPSFYRGTTMSGNLGVCPTCMTVKFIKEQ